MAQIDLNREIRQADKIIAVISMRIDKAGPGS